MADRLVKVTITGSSAGAVKAFTETALASDAAGDAISKSSGNMAKAVEGSTSTSGFSLKGLGNTLFGMVPLWGKVGIAAGVMVAGVVTGAVYLAAKFQESTDKLAASAGISITAAKAIGSAFLTTGGQTTFSAQQMLEAFTPVAGQLALMNGKALTAGQSLAFMRSAMDLAEASGQSLTSTTTALAQVMQAYQIPVGQAGKATDELYNTSRVLNVPVATLTTSMDQLHAKLGPLAPSLGNVSSLLIDLTSHGLTGSRAMLLVSTGMSTLLGGSKPVTAELKTLGLNVYDSTGKFVGMQAVIGQLSPKLSTMTEAQRLHTEQLLFGKTAALALDSTLSAGLPAWNAATVAATKAGTAHAAAATATSGLGASFEKIKGAIANAGVTLGQYFLPLLTVFMKGVAAVAAGLATALVPTLSVLGTILKYTWPLLAGMAIALTAWGVQVLVVSTATKIWTGLQAVFNVVMDANPIGLVVLAIAALAAGIIVVASHFSFFKPIVVDIMNVFKGLGTVVSTVFGGIADAVKGAINGVIGIINFFIGLIDAIQVHIHVGPVGIDWNGLNLKKIPTLDTGGIVTKPTLALLAANSKPEAVIPIGSGQFQGAGGGGAGSQPNVTIYVTSNDGQAVVNALKRYMYANGPLPITVNRARALGS